MIACSAKHPTIIIGALKSKSLPLYIEFPQKLFDLYLTSIGSEVDVKSAPKPHSENQIPLGQADPEQLI